MHNCYSFSLCFIFIKVLLKPKTEKKQQNLMLGVGSP